MPETYFCEICPKAFPRRYDWTRHQKSHCDYQEREFECWYEGCLFRANQYTGLERHIKSRHKKERVECDQPGCFATFSDASTLTRHRQSIHGALTRAEVRARRQVDVEEDTAVGKVGQPCRMRVGAVESETAQRASPPTMQSSNINKSKEHQLVAVAQHHRQPTHGVSGPRASSSRIVQQNVATCQRLQVEGDLGAMSALLDPQRDHQKKLPILSMTNPRMMWLNQPRIVLPRVPAWIPPP